MRQQRPNEPQGIMQSQESTQPRHTTAAQQRIPTRWQDNVARIHNEVWWRDNRVTRTLTVQDAEPVSFECIVESDECSERPSGSGRLAMRFNWGRRRGFADYHVTDVSDSKVDVADTVGLQDWERSGFVAMVGNDVSSSTLRC